MSLPADYTDYPMRREGYDHDLYAWSNIHERTSVRWPNNRSVAIFLSVNLEYFPIIPEDEPFRAPGHMVTPYPDYRHYTVRDYGNRVAVFRLLDAFSKAGIRVSFAINAAVAERYPDLIDAVKDGGHEIVAHSTDMNGTIASNMSEEDERTLVTESLQRLEAACGAKPDGWHSVARSQSFRTLDILREQGLCWCSDWVNDELPYRFDNGLIALPSSVDLSDRQIIAVQQHSPETWAQMMRDAFDWLDLEADEQESARILPMQITPYIMGQPFRIEALETLLGDLVSRKGSWFATGSEIVASWHSQQ